MSTQNELLAGVLAAAVSAILLGGSLLIAAAEDSASVAEAISITPSTTLSPTPVNTLRPGDPTHTPSLTSVPTKSPTPVPSTSCAYPQGWVQVSIQEGDSLQNLAETYDTSPEELAEANCLLSDSLPVGASIYVPPLPPTATLSPSPITPPPTQPIQCGPPSGWVTYRVQSGDNLYRLSLAYGVTVAQLQQANCLGASTKIKTGQVLYVPNVPTRVVTKTPSWTPTQTLTTTATKTSLSTATKTPTSAPTNTATNTNTPIPTPTVTNTFTTVPTSTHTTAPTATSTDTPTPAPTTP